MRRLALFVVRRRWWVIAVALVALPLSALYGGGVHGKLSPGGFVDPGSESARTAAAVAKEFPSSAQSDFVILVTAKHGTVKSPAVRAAGLALTERLRRAEGVATAFSYWSLPDLGALSPLSSRDQRQALVFASLRRNGRLEDRVGRQAGARVRRRHQGHQHRRDRSGGRHSPALRPGREGPSEIRFPQRPVHVRRTRDRLRQSDRGVLAARRRVARGIGNVRPAHRPRATHDRLGVLAQSGDRARLGARDRLQPVCRLSLPRRAGPRRVAGRRDRKIDADGRSHRRVQRGHRCDFAHGAGDLPRSVSSIVRVRGCRGCDPCGRFRRRGSSGGTRRPGITRRALPSVQDTRGDRGRRMGSSGRACDASSRAVRRLGQSHSPRPRNPVLPSESWPLRRPGRTEEHEQPSRHRAVPQELRDQGGRRAVGLRPRNRHHRRPQRD